MQVKDDDIRRQLNDDNKWYFLLDFNDLTKKEYIINQFNKDSLYDLTIQEINQLYEHAIKNKLS